MRMFKLFLAALGCVGLVALANGATLQKGLHYDVIEPAQPTEVPGKIEVIEFFSYGCPHCFHLEATINPWIRKLPKDVNFLRVPLSGSGWVPTSKLFYTLDAMGIEDKLHSEVFSAIHGDKSLNGNDEAAIMAWAAKKGLDSKKFNDIYKSFAIQSKVQRAVQIAASHKVTDVPAIVVDGRYLVLSNTIQSYDDLINLADQVVDMARTNKK